METRMVPRDDISVIVAHRDAAIAKYREYFAALEAAQKLLADAVSEARLACGGNDSPSYSTASASEVEAYHRAVSPPNVAQLNRTAERLTDLRVWASLIERTDLEVLMDATAKAELRAQMQYIPEQVDRADGSVINQEEIGRGIPPVTEDAVFATLDRFREDAGAIFRRGISEAFSRLDRRFRSHDGFKIGSRVILTRAFSPYGGGLEYGATRDTLLDIERVFLVLDGKTPESAKPEYKDGEWKTPRPAYAGIVGVIEEGRRGHHGPHQGVYQGDYFKVRGFQNGNAHLWFTRKDLVDKVNLLLADYYGAGLGWGKAEQEEPEAAFESAALRKPAKNYGLFPTPDSIAEKVIEKAKLYSDTPLSILEPSAGTGQLASRAANYGKEKRANWREGHPDHRVRCIEIQPTLAAELQATGLYGEVLCRDFLQTEPRPMFDRVIMNPPFDRGRDIDHVNHALQWLKPGGRLVAIMSQSAEFSQSRKAKAFRAKVEAMGAKRSRWTDSVFEDLPAGSFAPATNANTVLLAMTVEEKS